jgi:3-hydroxyisobutyrate dehydrogenase-like beta-hydroxyacid dehydrogenase
LTRHEGRDLESGPAFHNTAGGHVGDIRSEQIGIVGVGNMGGAIARSVLRNGFRLQVFDLRPEAVSDLVALGASAGESVDAVAASSKALSVVVVSDEQVRAVGRQIVAAASAGTYVLIHSTVRPSTVVELAERAEPKGVTVMDVSVNGGNEKAALGTLTLMVGGPDEAVRDCWPLFEAFGQHIFHMGPVGSGVVGKLVNNLIALSSYALQLEAMRLAAAYGLDEDVVTTAVIASMGDCRGIRTWGRHDRKRAQRAAQGTDWSERMGRDLEEAAIAAGLREVTLPLTATIAEAMPNMLRRRDRELAARGPVEPIPRCKLCDQELAAVFREAGVHPECTPGGSPFPGA